MIKRKLENIEIRGESTYFELTKPFFHCSELESLSYYAVIIGDRDWSDVKVFLPTKETISILKKIFHRNDLRGF